MPASWRLPGSTSRCATPHPLAGGRIDFSSDWTWTDEFILDAGLGLPQHPEQLRGFVGPDLRRADPGMARPHPRHLELGHLQPQPGAPLHRFGDQRSLHPAAPLGWNAAGARQPVLSGAAVAQLFRPRRDDRRHRGRPALRRRAQHPRREAAGRRHRRRSGPIPGRRPTTSSAPNSSSERSSGSEDSPHGLRVHLGRGLAAPRFF